MTVKIKDSHPDKTIAGRTLSTEWETGQGVVVKNSKGEYISVDKHLYTVIS